MKEKKYVEQDDLPPRAGEKKARRTIDIERNKSKHKEGTINKKCKAKTRLVTEKGTAKENTP